MELNIQDSAGTLCNYREYEDTSVEKPYCRRQLLRKAFAAAIKKTVSNPSKHRKKETMPEEDFRLWLQYKNDPTNREIQNELVMRYRVLVYYQVQRLRLPRHINPKDLIGEGMIGLIKGVKDFDIKKGVPECYLEIRIKGAMLDALRREDWVPRNVRSRCKKIKKADEIFFAQYGRSPNSEELASMLKIDVALAENMLREMSTLEIWSTDKVTHEFEDSEKIHTIQSNIAATSPAIGSRLEEEEEFSAFLKSLCERDREIMRLSHVQNMTQAEIAVTRDCTQPLVARFCTKIYKKLRHRLQQPLKDGEYLSMVAERLKKEGILHS